MPTKLLQNENDETGSFVPGKQLETSLGRRSSDWYYWYCPFFELLL